MGIMKRHSILIIVVFLGVVTTFPAGSLGWFSNPWINTVVEANTVNQIDHAVVADGTGGAIVTWAQSEDPCSAMFDIYTKRIDSFGEPAWSASTAICTAPGSQKTPQILADGTGGAIIVWIDARSTQDDQFSSFDLYAQSVNSQGQVVWDANGVPVTTAPQWQVHPMAIPDGTGGAFIAWDDGRSDTSQVFIQRIDQNGNVMWQQDGIRVADGPYGQSYPHIAPDGQGGVIIVWTQDGPMNCMNIFAQRLDANGAAQWQANGIPLCDVVGNQHSPHIVSDNVGGGFVSWADGRLGDENVDIYAQRIANNGAMLWAEQGTPIVRLPGNQVENAIVKDATGGAVIVWTDSRKQSEDTDIYAQKITPQGNLLWDTNGVAVAATEEYQTHPAVVADDAGGVLVTWQDFFRSGDGWNVYAQHIEANSQPTWEQDGIAVCIADGHQVGPAIISDGSDGAIIVWQDGRTAIYNNLFAQQISSSGLLGGGEFRFYTSDIDGNPKDRFNPNELIFFRASWIVPAPETEGTYSAGAMMVINSETDFRQEDVNYNVKYKDADLNGDGKVDLQDFSILAGEWCDTPVKADLNNDDKVDVKDLRILCRQWNPKE
jgi:hypothetical protein